MEVIQSIFNQRREWNFPTSDLLLFLENNFCAKLHKGNTATRPLFNFVSINLPKGKLNEKITNRDFSFIFVIFLQAVCFIHNLIKVLRVSYSQWYIENTGWFTLVIH